MKSKKPEKVAEPRKVKRKGKLGKKMQKKVKAQMLSALEDLNETVGEDYQSPQVVLVTKKVPKIRRAASTENVEENFIIVPWASKDEWNAVCLQLHDANYEDVIARIAVWQRRVPTLPVGVEATLFLLEAIVYDKKFTRSISNVQQEKGIFTEDQTRSLYSLAIIRYLNHVSQLATQSLGETKRLTRELAAAVDTPEWLVSLRNEVSHGPSAPSLEILRMGGNFVLQWLKDKYWKLPGETESASTAHADPFTISGNNEEDIPSKIGELIAAYIAARVYKLRHLQNITDPDIIGLLPTNLPSVKTKAAIMYLRNSLRDFFGSHPAIFSTIVSQELIPSVEFYEDFFSLFNTREEEDFDKDEFIFRKLYGMWNPILKQLETKGKFLPLLNNLCDIMINPDYKKMWMVAGRWIDKLLEIIETSGKRYSKQLVILLGTLVKHPNKNMELFLERLFRLTEPRLGSDAVQKLSLLASIWLDDKLTTKKRRIQTNVDFFTLTDIGNGPAGAEFQDEMENSTSENGAKLWMPDARGEEFWRNVPFGSQL